MLFSSFYINNIAYHNYSWFPILGKKYASDKQEETEKYNNCNLHSILDVSNGSSNTELYDVLIYYAARGTKSKFHENKI